MFRSMDLTHTIKLSIQFAIKITFHSKLCLDKPSVCVNKHDITQLFAYSSIICQGIISFLSLYNFRLVLINRGAQYFDVQSSLPRSSFVFYENIIPSGSILRCTRWKNYNECENLVTDNVVIRKIEILGDDVVELFDLDTAVKLLKLDITQISSLSITNTSMTQIQFSSLSNLEHLDLRYNRLASMPPPASNSLKSMNLSGNPWKCFNPEDPSASKWTYSRFSRLIIIKCLRDNHQYLDLTMATKCFGCLTPVTRMFGRIKIIASVRS